MDEWIDSGVSIDNNEVTKLYKTIPNNWVLLESMEVDDDNKATKVKILKYNKNKEVLREHLLDKDDWGSAGTLIYFYTGNDGTCKI